MFKCTVYGEYSINKENLMKTILMHAYAQSTYTDATVFTCYFPPLPTHTQPSLHHHFKPLTPSLDPPPPSFSFHILHTMFYFSAEYSLKEMGKQKKGVWGVADMFL